MAKQMTEKEAELLVERLIRRVEQANILFLEKVGNTVKKIRELTPSQAQKLIQILKYGGTYEEIIQQISKYTDLNLQDIDNIMSNYAKKDRQFYEEFYRYRNIPFDESSALKSQRKTLTELVKTEMYDYTRKNVLGYAMKGLDKKKHFYGLRETYNRVLDEAFLNVGQGKETFDEAMSNILKKLGGSGLRTIEYKDTGYSMRLDSAIRMHLKNRLRELHNENQKIIGEEIEADGVEISVHENPAPDHTEAQGRQFSTVRPSNYEKSEWEKLQAGEEATDYTGKKITLNPEHRKTHRPISEMNCYHYIFSIILGVNKPEYDEKQLQEIKNKNKEGFEYEGKHYTMYEGTQIQRNIEKNIRQLKDIQILAKASDNKKLINECQSKITVYTNKYNTLNKVSGLSPKAKRLTVSGYKRVAKKDLK